MAERVPPSRNILDLYPEKTYESYLFFDGGINVEDRIIKGLEAIWSTIFGGPCDVLILDPWNDAQLGVLRLGKQDWFEEISSFLKIGNDLQDIDCNAIFDVCLMEERNVWSLWKLNDYQIGVVGVNAPRDSLMCIDEVRHNFFTSSDVREWMESRRDLIDLLCEEMGCESRSDIEGFFSRFV